MEYLEDESLDAVVGEQPDTYECEQCGGSVNFIRNNIYDHIEVEYYRCQDEFGCRDGGERVYDRSGELIRTVGPVFDDTG